MATWEQILTSGTSISKLADVTITSADAGDVLICDGSGVWVDAVISGTTNEIVVTSTAGAINVKQPDDVTIGNDLIVTRDSLVTRNSTVTGDLVVNGGAAIISASVDGEDASLTIKGGATDKDAIINLYPDQGVSAGDEWEIRAANDGVLTFKNDKKAAGELDVMMTLTPDATTVAASKLTIAGDLHVGGDMIRFANGESFTQTNNVITADVNTFATTYLTATGSVTVAGNTIITDGVITDSTGLSIAAAVDLGSNTLTSTGSLQIRTIDYTDGDLAMTIADGGKVTTSGDLQVGTSLQTATIDYTDGDLALTIADGGAVTTAGDLTVNGNILGDADEAKVIFAATTTDTNFITIGGGGRVKTAGDLQVHGNDVYSSTSNCLSLDGTDVDVIGDLVVRGNTIGSSGTDSVIEFVGTDAADVQITGNLTVAGTTVTLDTETLLVEDNVIVLNSNATGNAEDGPDAGIRVKRGDVLNNKDAALYWDESYVAVDRAAADLGGRWAVGVGTESGSAFSTAVTVGGYGGYLVAITESAAAPHASDDLATGLGAMHIKTGSPGQIYIRVA